MATVLKFFCVINEAFWFGHQKDHIHLLFYQALAHDLHQWDYSCNFGTTSISLIQVLSRPYLQLQLIFWWLFDLRSYYSKFEYPFPCEAHIKRNVWGLKIIFIICNQLERNVLVPCEVYFAKRNKKVAFFSIMPISSQPLYSKRKSAFSTVRYWAILSICIFDSARNGECKEQGLVLVWRFLNFRDAVSLLYFQLP